MWGRSTMLWLALSAVACGGDAGGSEDAGTDGGVDGRPVEHDAGGPDTGPMACGTAGTLVPEGVETLSYYDDDPSRRSLEEQGWSVTVNGTTYVLAEQVAYEQARFELTRPARIRGFSVKWDPSVGEAPPETELQAGLYPDFGYNGFDMWQDDPLFTGTRCAGDIGADGWLDYMFDEPVVMDQPGLVFVAHRREGPGAPGWLFDASTDDPMRSCEEFDACRSSLNIPDAQRAAFYRGVTLQLPFDYVVRLYVEHTDHIGDGDRRFQPTPVATGSQVAWGDFDGDGWEDFVSDGRRLMRNQADGSFADATDDSGITALGVSGTGGVWGDYDNDGCLDLFLYSGSRRSPDALLHNQCDGTFTDATEAAGVTDTQSYEPCGDPANTASPAAAAAWVDLDADGWLDLYVSNYICSGDGGERYYRDYVWHNVGDGTFESWSGTRGFSSDRRASRGAAPIDHDRDGDVDLLVNTYRLQQNYFFDNEGGTFVERSEGKNLGGDRTYGGGSSRFGHTIGVAWGDLDNDGDFDVVQANLAHPRFYHFSDKTQVLLNQRTGGFHDNGGTWELPAGDNGLRYQETHSSPVLADFDHDGNLDLVITCVYDGRPTDFYWGNGDGTFRLDTFTTGITTEGGWGAAAADYDHDGDADIAAQTLFENTGRDPGHWLSVAVVGNVSANRAGIGATVAVTTGGTTRIRHVQGGSGQGCQDSQYLHFGLGEADTVDSIEVQLPGGDTVRFSGPFDADQRLWLMEDGSTHPGWAPP